MHFAVMLDPGGQRSEGAVGAHGTQIQESGNG